MQSLGQITTAGSGGLVNSAGTSLVTVQGANLATGKQAWAQVTASEPVTGGRGYLVQVNLAQGGQLSWVAEQPLTKGQLVQLTGRTADQLEVRLVQPAAGNLTAHHLLNQIPPLAVRAETGQAITQFMPASAQAGSFLLAQVVASQPALQGQGFTLELRLPLGQLIQINSSQALTPGTAVALSQPNLAENSATTNAERLAMRPLTLELTQLLNWLQIPSLATSTSTTTAPAASVQTLLQTASAQLRQALPRQAPLNQALQQLSHLTQELRGTSAPRVTTGSVATSYPAYNPPSTLSTTTATSQPNQEPGTNLAKQTLASAVSQNANSKDLAELNRLLTAAVRLVPQANQPPTAASLQQFIPLSGLLLEASLLRGSSASLAGGDLKLLLQQASSLLRQGLPANAVQGREHLLQQVAQQVNSALARIQVQQNSSLQASLASQERGQPAQVLQLDLPYVVRGDWLQAQLEIRRWIEEKDAEAAREEAVATTRSWEVKLNFDLPNWGKIQAVLRLRDQELQADIWIAEAAAFTPIQQQAEVLAARLRRAGAEVTEVNFHLGAPVPITSLGFNQQIIDTKI